MYVSGYIYFQKEQLLISCREQKKYLSSDEFQHIQWIFADFHQNYLFIYAH